MVHDSHGLHHFHKKKSRPNHEPHPKFKKFIDKGIYAVGVFGPIMTVPQVIKIWVEQNAAGVSVVSWASYLLAAVFWLVYGIVHREKPIIFTHILWIILELLVVIGVLRYG